MRRIVPLLLVGAAAACASTGAVPSERLRTSARDAQREARTVAVKWAEDAELRFVEGEGVTPEGYVLPATGSWRFVYDAEDRADQLAVTVTARGLERVVRPPQSPPGFVLGGAALGAEWIDSPAVLAAVRTAAGAEAPGGNAAISMLLVPLRPTQWIVRATVAGRVREWRVDAQTGQVIH